MRTIYDQIKDGIIVVDAESDASSREISAYCLMLGLSAEELCDVSAEKVHRPECFPKVREHLEAVKQNGIARIDDLEFVRSDGSLVYADVVSSLIEYNRRPCWISFFTTSPNASESRSVRQSEQKYKGLVEASPDAVIIADVNGIVLFASHHTAEFLGFSEEADLVGRSVLDFVIESDRPRLASNIPDLMKTRIRRNTEYTARRPDGMTFPVEISAAAGPNTEQQPWAILAVVRDISERKQAEETLQKEHYTLKHLLTLQRSRTAVDRVRNPRRAGSAVGRRTHADRNLLASEGGETSKRGESLRRRAHHATAGISKARRLISGVRPPILDESGVVAAVAHLVNEQRLQYDLKIEFHGDVSFHRLVPILENAVLPRRSGGVDQCLPA